MCNCARIFFVFSFVLFSLSSGAQVCLWARTAGTRNISGASTQGASVVTDKKGNVYVSGNYYDTAIYFNTSTSLTLPIGHFNNSFLAKYDSVGNLKWAKNYGGPDAGFGPMAIDTFGNILVGGAVGFNPATFGTVTIANPYNNAIFLLKLDSNGNFIWVQSAEGPVGGQSGVSEITTDLSGNVIIAGGFTLGLTFGSTNFVEPASESDIFIAKYNAAGGLVWAKRTNGTGSSNSTEGIATDRAGNVYITGGYRSSTIMFDALSLTNPVLVSPVTFVAKYSSAGNAAWVYNIGNANIAFSGSKVNGSGVTVDGNDNIYVMGLFDTDTLTVGSTKLLNAGANVTEDIFVAKFNSAGSPAWIKRYGGTLNDYGGTITTDASGNVYIGGEFLSASLPFGTYNLTHKGMYVAKLDNAGNPLWAKCADRDSSFATCVTHDAFGHLYVAGTFMRSMSIDAVQINKAITDDVIEYAYVAKFGFKPSAIPEIAREHDIHIFPNPANEELHIEHINANTTYKLYNILGSEVQQGILPHTNNTIPLRSLPPGMYLLQLTDEEGRREVRKVVKE